MEFKKPFHHNSDFCICICNKEYSTIQIVPSSSGPVVTLVDHARLHQLSLQVRRILMEQPSGKMSAGEFLRTFWNYFNQTLDLDQIDKHLAGIIQVHHNYNLNLMCR
jgi:ethanolamine utilization protein EutQ (cupin superfamily)